MREAEETEEKEWNAVFCGARAPKGEITEGKRQKSPILKREMGKQMSDAEVSVLTVEMPYIHV